MAATKVAKMVVMMAGSKVGKLVFSKAVVKVD